MHPCGAILHHLIYVATDNSSRPSQDGAAWNRWPKSHIPPWTNNNNSKDNALSTVFPARSCLPDNLCLAAYIRLCARWLSKDTTRRCPCIAAHNGQHRRTRLHQSNSAQEKWRALGNCQLRHTASQEDMHLSASCHYGWI